MSQPTTKSVILTANKAVRESLTQSTIQSGVESVQHYVSHINCKQGSQRVTKSVNHSVRHWVSPTLSQSHRQQTRWPEIILNPDLLLTKPKAISGQARKFNFLEWLQCERMTWVLSSAHAIWHEQFIFFFFCKDSSSDQINIFTKEVVFHLNITCKTIFILSFETF